jgi:hypothetical protein
MARGKIRSTATLLVLALSLGLVNSQGGFFSNVRNAIFGGGRPAGPPPNQRPPPNQQFGQPQQPQQQVSILQKLHFWTKTFRINFHPQILDKFAPKRNINI